MYATAVNGIIMNMKRRHLIHDKTKTATKTWTTTNNNIDNDERLIISSVMKDDGHGGCSLCNTTAG
ncbi:hypothetical protein MTR_2g014317 [Medicago truncatula]|uniref:Uncharacterized protein n=1 Tax=Medicago truncatula TaxID=3880 RepID=A0A072V4G8_MEDTR|nr:hypothetical protein MTR_2g014317 [Medicago truncatula]